MAIAPQQAGLGIGRQFTVEGRHPYDDIEWERRDARLINHLDGSVAFDHLGVEVPASGSVNATNILAQKYCRGAPGSPEREGSLREVIDRIVGAIATWGERDGYFVSRSS